MPNSKKSGVAWFVILVSSLIRHLSFVIRHF
jgi:hypothetical protein